MAAVVSGEEKNEPMAGDVWGFGWVGLRELTLGNKELGRFLRFGGAAQIARVGWRVTRDGEIRCYPSGGRGKL